MPTQDTGNAANITIPSRIAIASSTNASPIVVTTSVAHGLNTGDQCSIDGHATNTAANGLWAAIVVLTTTTFSLTGSTGNGIGGAAGHVQGGAPGATIQIPSDSDQPNAASVNVAFEALADKAAFIWGKLCWGIKLFAAGVLDLTLGVIKDAPTTVNESVTSTTVSIYAASIGAPIRYFQFPGYGVALTNAISIILSASSTSNPLQVGQRVRISITPGTLPTYVITVADGTRVQNLCTIASYYAATSSAGSPTGLCSSWSEFYFDGTNWHGDCASGLVTETAYW